MTDPNDNLGARDQRAFGRWLVVAARPYVAWVLVALGALSLFGSWYDVSGQSVTAKQLPYLASGGLGGIGLLVIAAGLLAGGNTATHNRQLERMQRKVDDLYALLVLDPTATAEPAAPTTAAGTGLVALPTGTTYHRAGCRLVAGKPNVAAVDAATISARSLTPCRVCDPPTADVAG
jgi:hypothetical protein